MYINRILEQKRGLTSCCLLPVRIGLRYHSLFLQSREYEDHFPPLLCVWENEPRKSCCWWMLWDKSSDITSKILRYWRWRFKKHLSQKSKRIVEIRKAGVGSASGQILWWDNRVREESYNDDRACFSFIIEHTKTNYIWPEYITNVCELTTGRWKSGTKMYAKSKVRTLLYNNGITSRKHP